LAQSSSAFDCPRRALLRSVMHPPCFKRLSNNALSSQGIPRPGPVCACRCVFAFADKAATYRCLGAAARWVAPRYDPGIPFLEGLLLSPSGKLAQTKFTWRIEPGQSADLNLHLSNKEAVNRCPQARRSHCNQAQLSSKQHGNRLNFTPRSPWRDFLGAARTTELLARVKELAAPLFSRRAPPLT
jgi:hypothetical protein